MADPNRWPELENAIPALAGLYPEATKVKVQPMGWIERNLMGGKNNVATTDLDGTIHYNKEAGLSSMKAGGLTPDQILAHELQHVRQNNQRGLLSNVWERVKQGRLPWESRPDEIEAMAAENRPQGFRRTTDIQLNPPQPQPQLPGSLQGLGARAQR